MRSVNDILARMTPLHKHGFFAAGPASLFILVRVATRRCDGIGLAACVYVRKDPLNLEDEL